MVKRSVCLLLAILCCFSLFSCLKTDTDTPESDSGTSNTSAPDSGSSDDTSGAPETGGADTTDTPVEGDDESDRTWATPTFTSSNADNVAYFSKYADYDAAETWLDKNIASASCPPVNFTIDGKNSDKLTWTRSCSDVTKVIDYAETDPKERAYFTLTYTCEEYDVAVEVVVTSYPDFPVIEYEATLINTSDGTSERIKNLNSIDKDIYPTDKNVTLRYYTGATPLGIEDYHEKTKLFTTEGDSQDNKLTVRVTNGKPTSSYLPDFSIEQEGGGGVIAILSWQGNWRAKFTYDTENGVHMTAGQNITDFNLLEGETHRFPATVLIFYKDSYVYGQNIYRRWFYQHNYMRENKEKMGLSVPFLSGRTKIEGYNDLQNYEECDLGALSAFEKYGSGLSKFITQFHQDAGWYKYLSSDSSWALSVGNWEVDTDRYPNGLKAVSDKAKELGLGYTLWIEPEHAHITSSFAEECEDYLLKWYIAEMGYSDQFLINLGIPEACDKVIDMVNSKIKESGATIYRQDFNVYPANYWSQYDAQQKEELGILRNGRTEEQYLNGYLRLLDGVLEANDGIIIDTCASGGMRYDLATARKSYCHQRSDWTSDPEEQQSDTYVSSKWMVCWGCSFCTYGSYSMRSRISMSLAYGVVGDYPGFDYETEFAAVETDMAEWYNMNSYTFEDYYTLSEYISKSEEGILAMQYDCPSSDNGMVVAYVRGAGQSDTLHPYALDPDALYRWYDADDVNNVHTATGKEITENGFRVESGTKVEGVIIASAKVFYYEKAE